MPRVLNKRTDGHPASAIYVGRPSIFGNPYVVGEDGTRDEVIQKYRDYLFSSPVRVAMVKERLRGRDLVCWCSPQACHADVLMEVANDG
jgi:hypothetical protein